MSSRTDDELKKGIAGFYDASSAIWLDVWGEHMHHGYYDFSKMKRKPKLNQSKHKEAQIEMIDNAIDWAYGADLSHATPRSVVDVGCGVGGSSRHIFRRFDMHTGKGVSLSPYQIMRAQKFTMAAGLQEKLTYEVMDATQMKYEDDAFDLTWSMESGEHMPDKAQFMNELVRVTAPGGRVIVVTWCHRELATGETALPQREKNILDKINKVYFLPEWCAPSTYVKLAEQLGLEDVRQADWTEFIKPFWPGVIKSALSPRNFFRLLRTNKTTILATLASFHMMRGYNGGTVKFALITGRKPQPKPVAEEEIAAVEPSHAATAEMAGEVGTETEGVEEEERNT